MEDHLSLLVIFILLHVSYDIYFTMWLSGFINPFEFLQVHVQLYMIQASLFAFRATLSAPKYIILTFMTNYHRAL